MKKTNKIETKKTTRYLQCQLTTAELLEAGKAQADTSIALGVLENDRKRVVDEFKAKASALEAKGVLYAGMVATGYTFRDVACTEYLGEPSATKKTIVREDTGAQVAIEDMTQSELQRELVAVENEAADPAAMNPVLTPESKAAIERRAKERWGKIKAAKPGEPSPSSDASTAAAN